MTIAVSGKTFLLTITDNKVVNPIIVNVKPVIIAYKHDKYLTELLHEITK